MRTCLEDAVEDYLNGAKIKWFFYLLFLLFLNVTWFMINFLYLRVTLKIRSTQDILASSQSLNFTIPGSDNLINFFQILFIGFLPGDWNIPLMHTLPFYDLNSLNWFLSFVLAELIKRSLITDSDQHRCILLFQLSQMWSASIVICMNPILTNDLHRETSWLRL